MSQSMKLVAKTTIGSFIVNLGRPTKIPCGEGRVFQIGARTIAVFHTRDANVFATESTCPHKGGSLANAMVGAQKIMCALHNCVFDLSDGRPVGINCRPLKTYPTTINEQGDILVGIDEMLAARSAV